MIEDLERRGKVVDLTKAECQSAGKFIVGNAAGIFVPFDSSATIDDVLDDLNEVLDSIIIAKVWSRYDADYAYIIMFTDAAAWSKFALSKCTNEEALLIEETFDEGLKCYSKNEARARLLKACNNGWFF